MTASFPDLQTLAAERWPEAFVAEGDDAFALDLGAFAIRFVALPGDSGTALVRVRILDLADVPRAVGDRLLARFSNPSVKFPPAIFREYLMDGTGAAKPAKTRGIDPARGGARRESMTAGVKASLKRLVEDLKASGRKDLAKIVNPGNVKAGGASLLLRNLATTLDATPNDPVLARGAREITEALNADSGHLHGHGYLRLGNEVMLEASDI